MLSIACPVSIDGSVYKNYCLQKFTAIAEALSATVYATTAFRDSMFRPGSRFTSTDGVLGVVVMKNVGLLGSCYWFMGLRF